MKKFLTRILVISMLAMTLVGCGDKKDPASNDKVVERGTWKDNVYTNTFADLEATLPNDGWQILTDDVIDQYSSNLNKSLLDGKNYKADIVKQATFTDMMCMDADPTSASIGSNVMVSYINRTLGGTPDMTADAYLESLRLLLPTQGKASGIDYVVEDKLTDKTIGGETYKVLSATGTQEGMVLGQHYLTRVVGDTVIMITITISGETNWEDILGIFKE